MKNVPCVVIKDGLLALGIRTIINTNEFVPDGKFLSYDDDLDTGYYMYLVGKMSQWLKGEWTGSFKQDPPAM